MNHVARTKGFTLVELLLAMSFISALLVAIAVTVIQISGTYNRGITLKEVNQAGRSLSNELQRTITSGAPFSIESGPGGRYIVQDDWGGRLCTGQYSYIWNFGQALNNNDPSSDRLNVYVDDASSQIRFVKVLDPSAAYCIEPSKDIEPADAAELLNVGDHSLAIQSFTITSEATATDNKTRQRLYSITFFVGTNDQAALVDGGTGCKGPGEVGADLSYCSVQEFNIVARAGSEL